MSEFKCACPVCGQHIKCDSSQAGSQMECPTCFQKITVPSAPASEDQKFIITGTKVGDRPVPKMPDGGPSVVPAARGFPVAIVFIIFIGIAAAVAFVYRGTIFKSKGSPEVVESETNQPTAKAPPKPVVVAPPANDENWMLNLDAVTNFPDALAAGRIHGQDFIVERAVLQNGTLTLCAGKNGPLDFGVQINFGGVQPEGLAGKTINIMTNAVMAARITYHWQDGGQSAKMNFEGGYAMRLNFDGLAGNRLSGKIYLCTPDDSKSYVAGNFNAEIRKPKPKK